MGQARGAVLKERRRPSSRIKQQHIGQIEQEQGSGREGEA